jgi:hypothetical protein
MFYGYDRAHDPDIMAQPLSGGTLEQINFEMLYSIFASGGQRD